MGRRNQTEEHIAALMRTMATRAVEMACGPGCDTAAQRRKLAVQCKVLDSLSAALTAIVGERGALDDVDGGSAQDSKGFVEPRDFDDDYSRDHGMDSEYDHDMHVRPTRGPSTGIGFDLARPLNRKG